jgi:Putative zinc-finger
VSRHLGVLVSALVDGELDHDTRDQALAHVARCAQCRTDLDEERRVKALLAGAGGPEPPAAFIAGLVALAEPGEPMPPRSRRMPLTPVVPTLPPPGRRARSGSPRGRRDGARPGSRARRVRYATAGAVSVMGLVLGTAFAAGGAPAASGPVVVPPAAEMSVEHAAANQGQLLRDPAFDAVTASFGGLGAAPNK